MPEGNCRLCNKFGKLTFEHVPPKVSFNKTTRYKLINFLDYAKKSNPFGQTTKGKVEQGGIGFYSLCKSCNNFLGTTYVPAYQLYINSFIDYAKKKEFNSFEFTMHEFTPLKVLKQIVSMFFSINGEAFSENYRDLAEFILSPISKNLPERFRVFNYINTEGQLRNLGVMALGNLTSSCLIVASEITFPPMGYILTIDFKGQLPFHQEITSFAQYDLDEKVNFDFKIYRLPTHLPYILDYRDKTTIQNSINNKM